MLIISNTKLDINNIDFQVFLEDFNKKINDTELERQTGIYNYLILCPLKIHDTNFRIYLFSYGFPPGL